MDWGLSPGQSVTVWQPGNKVAGGVTRLASSALCWAWGSSAQSKGVTVTCTICKVRSQSRRAKRRAPGLISGGDYATDEQAWLLPLLLTSFPAQEARCVCAHRRAQGCLLSTTKLLTKGLMAPLWLFFFFLHRKALLQLTFFLFYSFIFYYHFPSLFCLLLYLLNWEHKVPMQTKMWG